MCGERSWQQAIEAQSNLRCQTALPAFVFCPDGVNIRTDCRPTGRICPRDFSSIVTERLGLRGQERHEPKSIDINGHTAIRATGLEFETGIIVCRPRNYGIAVFKGNR